MHFEITWPHSKFTLQTKLSYSFPLNKRQQNQWAFRVFPSTKTCKLCTCIYLTKCSNFLQPLLLSQYKATWLKKKKGNAKISCINDLPPTWHPTLKFPQQHVLRPFDLSWRVIKSSQVCQVNTDVILGKFPLGSHVSKWQLKVSHVWVEEGHWDIAENVSPGRCNHFVQTVNIVFFSVN